MAAAGASEQQCPIEIKGLQWGYSGGTAAECKCLYDFDIKVMPGSTCLLIGANGAGKSTVSGAAALASADRWLVALWRF